MTVNRFARHIGLPRGENLYQIKRGNNGVSKGLAEKIVSAFPQIDKLWLLTGEGEMFTTPNLRSAQIPCYREDLMQDLRNVANLQPDCRVFLPQIEPCNFAMLYLGREMGMMTPVGSTVMLRRKEVDAIIPGREYAIVTQKFVTLRIVRSTDKRNRLRLVAGDREHFDDIIVDTNEIEAIYEVGAKLIINN